MAVLFAFLFFLFQDPASTDSVFVDRVLTDFYGIYSASLDSALTATTEAQQISHERGWRRREGMALTYQGITYYLKGQYDKALASYLEAARILEAEDHKAGLAKLYNELFVYYRNQKQFDNAADALRKAESYALESNELEQLGTAYGNKAYLFVREEQFDSSYLYYQRTYKIRLQQKDSIGLGYVLLDLAAYHSRNGNLEKSLDFIRESTKIRKAIGDKQGVIINGLVVGEHLFAAGKFREAIPYFEKSIEGGKSIANPHLTKYSWDMLRQAQLELGNYAGAYEALNELEEIEDSLYNTDRERVIQEMQTAYETEKKDQEILVLNKENALQRALVARNQILVFALVVVLFFLITIFYLIRKRARANRERVLQEQKVRMREAQIQAVIASEEKERKRFASDLHDSMGQLISALQINMHNLQINANEDRENRDKLYANAQELLTEIQKEVRMIAFNLVPQVLTKEGLVPALREQIKRLNGTGTIKVQLQVFGLEKRMPELKEVSLYRIIQEWLGNVLRYGSAKNISIQFTEHETELNIVIEDDGEGFDLSKFEHSKGNGWRNINSRLQLIKGELDIDTQAGRKGTTFMIDLPNATAPLNQPLTTEQIT